MDADGALFIVVDILDKETGDFVWSDEDVNFDDWHYEIPAEVFTPGRRYRVVVFNSAVGFNADESVFTLAMLPENPQVLTLPAALNDVEEEAFAGVGAQVIVIPSTVEFVQDRAFADCPNLLMVEIEDGAQGIAYSAFEGSGAFMVYGTPGSDGENYANSNDLATVIYLD